MSLEGRVALVTGGSRGIGRAVARALAEDGADIAVHYNRDEEAAQKTVEAVSQLGRRALAVRAAIEDPEALAVLVGKVREGLGPVGILINNAGVASRGRSVLKTEADELERLMRIHALGPHELCKLVLPDMRKQERGDIVMVSSVATKYNAAGGAPYNMGKAAMESLALTLAAEERGHGIRVNVVAPGLVETEMGSRLMKATAGIDDLRQLDAQMPFGRVCQPEDIADTIRHLVSPRSAYTTGQRIEIDGGGQ
ncbi:MAG: SDR family oxidoreductase [Myxococcota bacterium]|nr:SDR family oxidoreductase [Myxococcota bacterium]